MTEIPLSQDLFENPLGLGGFEFIEFCAPEKGLLEPVFAAMADHGRVLVVVDQLHSIGALPVLAACST